MCTKQHACDALAFLCWFDDFIIVTKMQSLISRFFVVKRRLSM